MALNINNGIDECRQQYQEFTRQLIGFDGILAAQAMELRLTNVTLADHGYDHSRREAKPRLVFLFTHKPRHGSVVGVDLEERLSRELSLFFRANITAEIEESHLSLIK